MITSGKCSFCEHCTRRYTMYVNSRSFLKRQCNRSHAMFWCISRTEVSFKSVKITCTFHSSTYSPLSITSCILPVDCLYSLKSAPLPYLHYNDSYCLLLVITCSLRTRTPIYFPTENTILAKEILKIYTIAIRDSQEKGSTICLKPLAKRVHKLI